MRQGGFRKVEFKMKNVSPARFGVIGRSLNANWYEPQNERHKHFPLPLIPFSAWKQMETFWKRHGSIWETFGRLFP